MNKLLKKVRRMIFGEPGAKDISKVITQFEKGVAVLNKAADNCMLEVDSNTECIDEIKRNAQRRVYELESDNKMLITNEQRARKIATNFNNLCDI